MRCNLVYGLTKTCRDAVTRRDSK